MDFKHMVNANQAVENDIDRPLENTDNMHRLNANNSAIRGTTYDISSQSLW